MRTFEQLTVKERERALVASRAAIVEGVVCGIVEIELVDSHNQRTLDINLSKGLESLKGDCNENRRNFIRWQTRRL